MTDCDRLGACPFFNDEMANKPGMSQMYKKNYCLNDSSKCARFMVAEAIGAENIPSDLYPNMINKAEGIIAQARA